MEFTDSLKRNNDFRRIYSRGKSQSTPCLVVYFRRNHLGANRLGLTVSTKIGCAVQRNRIRRRLREIYRLNEQKLRRGVDIVVVSRHAAAGADYARLEREMLLALSKLGLIAEVSQ